MKKLNFDDMVKVNGGECQYCPNFGVEISLCIDKCSAPYVANLIGDFYAGNIHSVQDFTNAILNDISAGANFNKIIIEKVEIPQY